MHQALSVATMYDKAVFTNFMRNSFRVTTKQKIDVITNFVESLEELLAVNDGGIDTFVKYTHSKNNNRAAAQIIFIKNNITQGLKSMFLS